MGSDLLTYDGTCVKDGASVMLDMKRVVILPKGSTVANVKNASTGDAVDGMYSCDNNVIAYSNIGYGITFDLTLAADGDAMVYTANGYGQEVMLLDGSLTKCADELYAPASVQTE